MAGFFVLCTAVYGMFLIFCCWVYQFLECWVNVFYKVKTVSSTPGLLRLFTRSTCCGLNMSPRDHVLQTVLRGGLLRGDWAMWEWAPHEKMSLAPLPLSVFALSRCGPFPPHSAFCHGMTPQKALTRCGPSILENHEPNKYMFNINYPVD